MTLIYKTLNLKDGYSFMTAVNVIRYPWCLGCCVIALCFRLRDSVNVFKDPWCVGRHGVCCVMAL
jgi:hypothetical protein